MTKAEKLAYDRQWRRKNRKSIRAAYVKYSAKHRVRILRRRRQQYAASPARRDYNNAWNRAHPIRAKRSRRRWHHLNRGKTLCYFAKARAKRKDIPFNLEPTDVVVPTHCPVFGWRLTTKIRKSDPRSPSLDRIIPKKGYVRGNIAVVSLRANLLKNNATLSELRAIVRWLERQ